MVGFRLVRAAALALGLYGILGVFVSAAMVIVGIWTFDQLVSLQATLETQRAAIVQSIRTVSGAVHDTGGATTDVRQSIDSAQSAANQASVLSNDSARHVSPGRRQPDQPHGARYPADDRGWARVRSNRGSATTAGDLAGDDARRAGPEQF